MSWGTGTSKKQDKAVKKEEKKETKERGKDIAAGQKIDNGTVMSGRQAARYARRMNGTGR
ncbi:hypothetical protein [Kribbella sp. NPDC004536]|uniref:hypothetical protein n=1 Tax=Kribbella sp. NPDC004536 TaxID=3364106 RepID=UPI00367CEECE